MPVAFPSAAEVDLEPPGPEEARAIARGIAGAISGGEGLTALQAALLEELGASMTGYRTDAATASA